MDKKKKIIIAVSVVVVIVVVAVVVILTSNSSKEEKYTENTVVEIVTDENGEAVTDENGDVVTVVSEKEGFSSTGNSTDESDGSESSGSGAEQTNAAGGNNSNQNGNEITSAGNNGNNGGNSGNNSSAADETNNSSSEAEQEKPKARNVTVDVVLPYYNKQETEVTVLYKAEGDEKYSKLEPLKLKLDKSGKKESFDLGELKGEVSVTVTFSGIKISENSITIPANENTGTIRPVTGIEILEGEDD